MAQHDRELGRWGKFIGLQSLLRLFRIGDPAQQAQQCEAAAAAADAIGNMTDAANILDEAATWWKRAGDREQAERCTLGSVNALKRVADIQRNAGNVMAAVHWLEATIKKLRTLRPASRGELEKELTLLLAQWQREQLGEFRSTSIEIDVTDMVQQARTAVADRELLPALLAFANLFSPLPTEKRRQEAEETVKSHPIQYLIQRIVVDEEGKTVKRLPSPWENHSSQETIVRHAMIESANRYLEFFGANIIEPARYTIMSEHPLLHREFRQILEHSPFVPAGREDSWAAGIVAGFAGDIATALHLLIPQLEHALRVQVRLRGHAAVNMNASGEQQDWVLSSLLQGDQRGYASEIIGEDTAFELRALMLEKEGANLRNRMFHGLLPDHALQSGRSLYLFWLCVRLCMLSLIEGARKTAVTLEAPEVGSA
jgi:hypothetical protein